MKRLKFPKIFFGWWTVLAVGVMHFFTAGYNAYGVSTLFKPIASELSLSRAQTSISFALTRLEGGIEGPVLGWMCDRFGPKWIILVGVFVEGLGLVMMYFVNSLWALILVWGVIIGTGHQISSALPLDIALSNWFVKKRGKALGIKWLITGASGVVGPPVITWLILTGSWRTACLYGGLAVWLCLPLIWFFVRNRRPEYYGLLPDGATEKETTEVTSQMIERGVKYAAEVEEAEFTLRQALRTPAFWLLVIATGFHSLASPIVSYHSIPFLTDIGYSPLVAAAILSLYYLVGLPLRFIGGLIADALKKNYFRFVYGSCFFVQTVGFAIYLLHQTPAMVYPWFILYGIGNGLTYGFHATIWARYFGRKAIGSIRGAAALAIAPIAIFAPVYAGWVYDTTGSYITVFIVVTVLLFLSTAVMVMAIPPRTPARITDIHQIV